MTKFQYIHRVGERVRLRLFEAYARYNLPPWSVLLCQAVDGGNIVCERAATEGGKNDGDVVVVKQSDIEPPIGWKERYEIGVLSAEDARKVLNWLPRGITVRLSHLIGSASVAYSPGDIDSAPHWQYPEVTDKVASEDCDERIKIVLVDQECDPPVDDGDGNQVQLSSLAKPKRLAAIAAMKREGWKLRYRRWSHQWVATKETVVKDWGQPASEAVVPNGNRSASDGSS
jgi:hypothetical protein